MLVVLIPKYGLEGTLYLDKGEFKATFDEEVSGNGVDSLHVLNCSWS